MLAGLAAAFVARLAARGPRRLSPGQHLGLELGEQPKLDELDK
jgi:hypothetical protein